MTNDEKLDLAMDLLFRIEANETVPPDPHWYRDYYVLTGAHMILTDEGWTPGDCKQGLIEDYDESAILDEVNAPA